MDDKNKQAEPVIVPNGWRLVPIDPTTEIEEAIESALQEEGFDTNTVGEVDKRFIYQEAISAAPQFNVSVNADPAPSASPAGESRDAFDEWFAAKQAAGMSPADIAFGMHVNNAEVARERDAALRCAPSASPAALTDEPGLLEYVLQDDLHNRTTPRVIDIAYTAFMAAKQPNTEDGGPSDWFTDTRPVVLAAIEKLRKDLLAASPATPAPSALIDERVFELVGEVLGQPLIVEDLRQGFAVHTEPRDWLNFARALLAASPTDQVEDALDAKRYRWLRDSDRLGDDELDGQIVTGAAGCEDLLWGDRMDTAIDAAMSASKEGA